MYERVLVPLDGSKVGEAALPHVEKLVARRVAGGLAVEITLFQVLPSSHYVVVASAAPLVSYTELELEEMKKEGKPNETPYLENIKTEGFLNEKYPGGIERHKELLEAEGFKVVRKGKRFFVSDFTKYPLRES